MREDSNSMERMTTNTITIPAAVWRNRNRS
jgi:hypothetical protein